MKKDLRIKIWEKYDKHCAYCGKEIECKEMQVDHLFPQALKHWLGTANMKGCGSENLKDINDFDNLMPSCRSCNYHKNTFRLEQFRKEIKLKQERIKNSNVLLLERFNLISFNDVDVVFYFEKQGA